MNVIKYFIIIATIHGLPSMDKDIVDAVRARIFSNREHCDFARLAMRGWFDEHHPALADKYTAKCEPDGKDI